MSDFLCKGLLAARLEVRCALYICGAGSVTRYFRTKDNTRASLVIVWDKLHAPQLTCSLSGPACTGACQSNV